MLRKLVLLGLVSFISVFFTLSVNVWGQKVELTYWCTQQVSHEQMVKAFELQHPNISIKTTVIASDRMKTIARTSLATTTAPDLIYFQLGLGNVDPIIQADLVLDLEEAAREYGWKERITNFGLTEASHYGKLWAIPNEAELVVVYYNKQIFAELGVTVPTSSWDAFIDVCKKSEAAGYDPITLGYADKWPMLHRTSVAYQYGGGREAVRRALFEGAPLDTPQFIDGVKWISELDKKYMPNALGKTYEEGNAMFYAGRAAMQFTGTWFTEEILLDAPDPSLYGMFLPIPPGAKEPSSAAGCGSGWYITSSAKERGKIDAGLQFLDYCASEEAQKIWTEKNGCIPVVPLDLSELDVSPLLIESTRLMSENTMGYFMHHFVAVEPFEWMKDGYQFLLAGDITPEEYAHKLQELAEESRKEGFSP